MSSAFILQALNDNAKGVLYSIDLPAAAYALSDGSKHSDELPKGSEVGFVVANDLRTRWELILGDARRKLPELVNRLERINLFHHDSEHTYGHMTFEYNIVWPKLRDADILSSDDVSWNKSFADFAARFHQQYILTKQGGFKVKNGIHSKP